MITVIVNDDRHSLVQFQTETLPGIGDILTIDRGPNAVDCYTVISRGFFIGAESGGDDAAVVHATLTVRESSTVEKAGGRTR